MCAVAVPPVFELVRMIQMASVRIGRRSDIVIDLLGMIELEPLWTEVHRAVKLVLDTIQNVERLTLLHYAPL